MGSSLKTGDEANTGKVLLIISNIVLWSSIIIIPFHKVGVLMYKFNEYGILVKRMERIDKENYIADMLVRTLYSNNVNNTGCYKIIKLFKEKVLGNVCI